MTSFLQDFSESLEQKWSEVDVLIEAAKEERSLNEELYNVMCRSVSILIVSHLEGFIKSLVKSIINDLNRNVNFKDLPKAVQRRYCSKYIKRNSLSESMYNTQLNLLIDKFSTMPCEVTPEAFASDDNNNPNIGIIQSVFSMFGFKNVFFYIHESDLDNVFSMSPHDVQNLKRDLKNKVKEHTEDYPYSLNEILDEYRLIKKNKINTNRTLWEEFIVDTNQKRHAIAHGNNFENTDEITSLELRKDKTIILQYILIILLGSLFKATNNN